MGIIEDALTDFVVNHFEEELDNVQNVKSKLEELRSTVDDLEEKVDQLLDEDIGDGQTESASEEGGATEDSVTSQSLKALRDDFDLTQKELAEILDVSSVTISSWESGDTSPQKGNQERIQELQEKSKAEVDDLLESDEESDDTADEIRSVRNEHGLTQKEFAEVLDVSPTTVSNWEQGETNPSQERVEQIQDLDPSSDEDGEEDDSDASISGDDIKQIRTDLDLSQSELAEELGVSAGTVSNWERGESSPGSDNQEQIEDLAEQADADGDGDEDVTFSAEDLKELREEKDLSQSELADELGVSAGTISNWERGKGSVSESALENIKEL